MSGTSNQSTNLVSGIAIGIVAFCVFGFVTYGMLLMGNLKSPTDRIAAGDFSEEVKEIRAEVTKAAKASQSEAFDEAKVASAMKNFVAIPAAASAVDVPSLVEEEPVVEETAEEPKPAKVEQPKAKKPKAEKPKAEKPKAEELKVEEPKADEPKAEPASRKKPKAKKTKGKGKGEE